MITAFLCGLIGAPLVALLGVVLWKAAKSVSYLRWRRNLRRRFPSGKP